MNVVAITISIEISVTIKIFRKIIRIFRRIQINKNEQKKTLVEYLLHGNHIIKLSLQNNNIEK